MRSVLRYTVFLVFLATLVVVPSTWANGIKERMIARLPAITELKAQGVVGENNQGYLEFRTSDRSQASVVDAENKDRRTVYETIAQRQNTTPEFVGQARAAQIAGREATGTWIQDSSGNWSKK